MTFDWNWLWVVGEAGAAYGFYRWWKSKEAFQSVLEIAPDIDIDALKGFSSMTTSIDFVSIHGLAQPIDAKPSSVLHSQFLSDCTGVLQRMTTSEQKLERARETWTESKKLINQIIRYVPFRLISSKGNFVRIDKPLDFNSVRDQLEVTHIKFDRNTSSAVEKLVGGLIGDVSKGIETKEEMLLSNTPLTGFGRLEKRSGVWLLLPHEQWGGILTRLSRTELLSSYRRHAAWVRAFAILFGVLAGCTAIYLIHKYERSRPRPTVAAAVARDDNAENNEARRLPCIICMDNEITYSLQPCSHLGVCESCKAQLQAQTQQHCPICRRAVRHYQRVFLP